MLDMDFRYNGKDSLTKASLRKIQLHKGLERRFPDAKINISFKPTKEVCDYIPEIRYVSTRETAEYNLFIGGDFNARTLVDIEDYLNSKRFDIIQMNKHDGTIMRDYSHIRRGEN